MGKVYIRRYAGSYPNDVTGLVFIDLGDFTETKDDWRNLLRSLGVAVKRVEEMIQERLYKASSVDSRRYGPWSESEVLTNLRRTDFTEIANLPLSNVPIVFFVGGKFEVPPDRWRKDFNQKEFFQKRTDVNVARWRKFIDSSGKGGSLIYLSNCGHFVHRDDPVAVVTAIKGLFDGLK